MSHVLGFLGGPAFILGCAALWNVPQILMFWWFRETLAHRLPRVILAVGFAAGCFHTLWRMDWFDIWRHGVPPASFIVFTYVPYMLLAAAIGWWLASMIRPGVRTHYHVRPTRR